MLWTWNSYRNHADAWQRDTQKTGQHEDSLEHFLVLVDRLLYAAAAAFLICVAALLVR